MTPSAPAMPSETLRSRLRQPCRAASSAAATCCLALASSPAGAQNIYQPLVDRWVNQDTLDPRPPGAAVFVGSSSVRRHEHLLREFSDRDLIQRGFGGSTWDDALAFVDELVLMHSPGVVFVYEGSNDITQGKSPQATFDDYRAFVDLVRAGTPHGEPPVPIVQIGLVPAPGLWSTWPQRNQYNQLVKSWVEGDPTLFHVDMAAPFLATGSPPSSTLFAPDQVHLNEAGYALWTAALRPFVQALAPARPYLPNPLHPPVGRRLLVDLGPSNAADGGHAPSPDPFGSYWNNWYELTGQASSTLNPALAGLVFPGEHKGGLVTVRGEPSGFELEVTGGFIANGKQSGGLLNPQQALLGRFAVSQATQDFFHTNGYDSAGGFVVRGLDPLLRYDFRFFGSHASNETTTSSFAVTGKGAEQQATVTASGQGVGTGGYNGNNDTVVLVAGVRPDPRGQVFLDIGGVAAGGWGYLNALEIWIRPPPARLLFGDPAQKP